MKKHSKERMCSWPQRSLVYKQASCISNYWLLAMRTDGFDVTFQVLESTDGTSRTNTMTGRMAAGPSSLATKGDLVQGPLEMDAASHEPKARFTRAKFMLQVEIPDYVLHAGHMPVSKHNFQFDCIERESTTSSVELPPSRSWLRTTSCMLHQLLYKLRKF